ncbi:MAG: hypothetical protein RI894_1432 [Bacteroidota bacterium]|jgi:hypothetical protein
MSYIVEPDGVDFSVNSGAFNADNDAAMQKFIIESKKKLALKAQKEGVKSKISAKRGTKRAAQV